jgi:hypothetical protein
MAEPPIADAKGESISQSAPTPPSKASVVELAFLMCWKALAVLYTIVAIGLIIQLPVGILALGILYLIHLPVPITLMFFPSEIHMDVGYFFVLALSFAGVIFCWSAFKNIKKNWRWGYTFIALSLVQLFLVASNYTLGTCNLDGGDGGEFLDHCVYGLQSDMPWQIAFGCLMLVSAFLILYLAQKRLAKPVSPLTPPPTF